jgi:hypothetical protein
VPLHQGATYTAANLPLRSLLAAVSVVVTLLQEVQSRRAFALEHQQALASQSRRRTTKGGADWFKWGGSDDDLVKPANKKA